MVSSFRSVFVAKRLERVLNLTIPAPKIEYGNRLILNSHFV